MKPLVTHFGSLRTLLVLLALLAAVVLARPATPWLAPVFGALALNLACALATHARLRRQWPLLLAHLALVVLVAGAGLSRLLSLDGRFELAQGVPFDGRLIDGAVGAWHADRLHALAFRHEGFEIDYAKGRQRGATRNTVAWTDDQRRPQRAVIGDHRPLLLHGYRITTTPNKGFAPLLRWTPAGGTPQLGAVHLPSFPVHELKQSNEFRLPDGRAVWVMLQIDGTLIDPAAPARFEMPRAHRLVLRLDGTRAELQPGESLALPGGTLQYEALSTWMGYRITGDPTLPWLLGAALVASLATAWHYVRKFRAPRAAARLVLEPRHG